MQQSVFSRQEFYECTVRYDRANLTGVYFTYFRNSYDSLDHTHCIVDAFLVCSCNFDAACTVYFFNSDSSTGFFLHTLDNLSARADYSSDEFFRNSQSFNAWSMRFEFCARFCNAFSQFAEDVFTSLFSLHQCFFQNIVSQTVTLDIHLSSCDTVACTCNLEVHVTQVVFVSQNI